VKFRVLMQHALILFPYGFGFFPKSLINILQVFFMLVISCLFFITKLNLVFLLLDFLFLLCF
jgi:hypothetical protein